MACYIYEEALHTSVANTCSYELLYATEFVLDTWYMLTHYVLENFSVMVIKEAKHFNGISFFTIKMSTS